jgi:ribosomal-protein-alanine N-acetyltransferase
MTDGITSQRLSLNPVKPEDWREYEPIFSAPATARYSIVPKHPSAERARHFVDWMVRIGAQDEGFGWMIRKRDSGQLIGCIRLNAINKRTSLVSIGYELAEAHWGQGLATEALNAVVAHCHGTMGLYRLEAWTLEGNIASDRVLEKAGFAFEGTQREKALTQDVRHNVRLFARLASDPPARG